MPDTISGEANRPLLSGDLEPQHDHDIDERSDGAGQPAAEHDTTMGQMDVEEETEELSWFETSQLAWLIMNWIPPQVFMLYRRAVAFRRHGIRAAGAAEAAAGAEGAKKRKRSFRTVLSLRQRRNIALLALAINTCAFFGIMQLGTVLCPQFFQIVTMNDMRDHKDPSDAYISLWSRIYDISPIFKDEIAGPANVTEVLKSNIGNGVSGKFPVPVEIACADLIRGRNDTGTNPAVDGDSWYYDTLRPALDPYYKTNLTITHRQLRRRASKNQTIWAEYDSTVYNITRYIASNFTFLDPDFVDLFAQNSGKVITEQAANLTWTPQTRAANVACLDAAFRAGFADPRQHWDGCVVPHNIYQSLFWLMSMASSARIAAMGQASIEKDPRRNDWANFFEFLAMFISTIAFSTASIVYRL